VWSLPEALYVSVVTLTTVGYVDLTPSTAVVGKVFTIVYILVGIGITSAS
jgi:voltage-gated potassium channel